MSLTKVQPPMIGGNDRGIAVTPNATIYENLQSIITDYCITTGTNAVSSGPITIANGVIITIPDGSNWSIV